MLQRYVTLLRRMRQLARQQNAASAAPEQAQRLAAVQVLNDASGPCLQRMPAAQ